MDYALPRAGDIPLLELANIETPSKPNALGAKGVGESGTIGVPPAISTRRSTRWRRALHMENDR